MTEQWRVPFSFIRWGRKRMSPSKARHLRRRLEPAILAHMERRGVIAMEITIPVSDATREAEPQEKP